MGCTDESVHEDAGSVSAAGFGATSLAIINQEPVGGDIITSGSGSGGSRDSGNESWAECLTEYARLISEAIQSGRDFYLVTVVLWGASTVIAITFTDLGVVLSLTGAVGASILG